MSSLTPPCEGDSSTPRFFVGARDDETDFLESNMNPDEVDFYEEEEDEDEDEEETVRKILLYILKCICSAV